MTRWLLASGLVGLACMATVPGCATEEVDARPLYACEGNSDCPIGTVCKPTRDGTAAGCLPEDPGEAVGRFSCRVGDIDTDYIEGSSDVLLRVAGLRAPLNFSVSCNLSPSGELSVLLTAAIGFDSRRDSFGVLALNIPAPEAVGLGEPTGWPVSVPITSVGTAAFVGHVGATFQYQPDDFTPRQRIATSVTEQDARGVVVMTTPWPTVGAFVDFYIWMGMAPVDPEGGFGDFCGDEKLPACGVDRHLACSFDICTDLCTSDEECAPLFCSKASGEDTGSCRYPCDGGCPFGLVCESDRPLPYCGGAP